MMIQMEAERIMKVTKEGMARLEREARAEAILHSHTPTNFIQWRYAVEGQLHFRIAATLFCEVCDLSLVIKYKPAIGEKDIGGKMVKEKCKGGKAT